jgi:hypothetical protein
VRQKPNRVATQNQHALSCFRRATPGGMEGDRLRFGESRLLVGPPSPHHPTRDLKALDGPTNFHNVADHLVSQVEVLIRGQR